MRTSEGSARTTRLPSSAQSRWSWLPQGTALPHEVWAQRHRWILTILWLQVPGAFVFALARGETALHAAVECATIAAFAVMATMSLPHRRLSTVTAAVGLLTSSAVLVHLSDGSIEMHFHYFVMVGVVTLYQDWWPYLAAIAYVVLQHGVAGAISPESVYNHQAAIENPWQWAGVHGLFILAMSAAGIASWKLNESFLSDLSDREGKLSEAQRVSRLGSWDRDVATGTARWSAELFRLLGLDPRTPPSAEAFLEQIVDEDREDMAAAVAQLARLGVPYVRDVRVTTPEGEVRWLQVRGAPTQWSDDGPTVVSGTLQDITEAKRAEAEVRDTLSLLNATLDATADGILVVDLGGRITTVNRRFTELWGVPHDVLASRDDDAALAFVLDQVVDPAQFLAKIRELYARPDAESHDVIEFLDGRLLERSSAPQRVGGQVVGRVWSFKDITEQKRLETELAHQALHDSLTGLANQTLFRDRVEHALTRATRQTEHLAVLFFDLDNFKTVNDSLGHSAGDVLLTAVARRLESCMRSSDTTARLGGDEFAVLLEGLHDQERAAEVAELAITALAEPFDVSGREVVTGVSVGVAFGADGIDAGQLLRNADLAMYSAKRNGKGRCAVYQPRFLAAAVRRLDLEGDLRRALDTGQLEVHHQPVVSIAARRIVSTEALVRWHHPERGVLAPDEFIPLAEEIGLIGELGRQVMAAACAQAATWRRRHRRDLTVSVNVSPRQLLDDTLLDHVEASLDESGLPASALILEITETATVHDTDAILERLRTLGRRGVRLAVDDFGTGYASLSHLQRLPVDILKIDRSFVSDLGEPGGDTSFAATVVSLARSMDLGVVAEGVETAEQARALVGLGCDLLQGYRYFRPRPPDELDDVIDTWRLPAGDAAPTSADPSPVCPEATRVP